MPLVLRRCWTHCSQCFMCTQIQEVLGGAKRSLVPTLWIEYTMKQHSSSSSSLLFSMLVFSSKRFALYVYFSYTTVVFFVTQQQQLWLCDPPWTRVKLVNRTKAKHSGVFGGDGEPLWAINWWLAQGLTPPLPWGSQDWLQEPADP